ncbi:MAG: glycogen synthase GlgA [Desulfotomaculum sp.]|nr:glycogen synthase GlgA [Desulfotomaculum sp.]
MKVLFAASEAGPFIKTGGLGDVIGSLPKELRKQGIDARVMIPKYKDIPDSFKEKMHFLKDINVSLGWRNQYCGYHLCIHNQVPFYFVDNEYYFKRNGIYGFEDDAERFAFFSRAVLEGLMHLNFAPDIIHCHDWHTGMISVFLKAHYQNNSTYKKMRTIFTVHNLQYQGIFPREILRDILSLDESYFNINGIKFYGQVNYLKGGLMFSDLITTVSSTYAKEIQTTFFGEGLDGVLSYRNNVLYGILNGIDYQQYNPENDIYIYQTFNKNLILEKQKNKEHLQRFLCLPVDNKKPIIAIISRLVSQKGLDLIAHILDEIMDLDLQLVILGTGDPKYEQLFINASKKYPGKISANITFDNILAHKIYAGADMFLMPSLFEPCGLGQLIAMRYGCVPIVRETGGLKDTVESYNKITGKGNGFSFTNYNAHDLLYTIKRAVKYYSNQNTWEKIVKQAMSMDYSWKASALKYKALYEKLII